MHEIGQAGADAVFAVTKSNFTVGCSTKVLYAAAGGADDYACGEVGIPVCYTLEVNSEEVGFEAPPEKIEPLAQESWIAIKAMARELIKKY